MALSVATVQREQADLRRADEQLAHMIMQIGNGFNAMVTQLQSQGVLPKEEMVPEVKTPNIPSDKTN